MDAATRRDRDVREREGKAKRSEAQRPEDTKRVWTSAQAKQDKHAHSSPWAIGGTRYRGDARLIPRWQEVGLDLDL